MFGAILGLADSRAIHSLETEASFSTSTDHSQESWHSVDLNFTLLVDIESLPDGWELFVDVFIESTTLESKMGSNDFLGGSLSVGLIKPEVTIWEIVLSSFSGVVLVKGLHKLIVSSTFESVWNISHVSVISTKSVHVSWVWILIFLIISNLEVFIIRRGIESNSIRIISIILRAFLKILWLVVMMVSDTKGINLVIGVAKESG